MNHRALPAFMTGLTWVLLLAVACSSPAPTVAPTSTPVPPTATPTSLPPTPTPVLVPTPAAGGWWNYAVLGDSSAWGFPKFYAQDIEADLGIKVKVLDWTVGLAPSARVLQSLRDLKYERRDVSQAQVVTFYGNPLHLIDRSPQALATYKAELGAIAHEILALCRGQPTIIRTYTRFQVDYRKWEEQGEGDENRRWVAALDAVIFEVGKERGILVADVGLALNSSNRDQDPNGNGYLYDGMHENDQGAQVVADVFRNLVRSPDPIAASRGSGSALEEQRTVDTAIVTPRGNMTIRVARAGDAPAYRDLRLEALRDHPDVFSSDYAENLAKPMSFWTEGLQPERPDRTVMMYFAVHEQQLIGMSGIARPHSPKVRHSADIVGMYVRPEWRGLRIAGLLVNTCLDWARTHDVATVKLAVVTTKVANPGHECRRDSLLCALWLSGLWHRTASALP